MYGIDGEMVLMVQVTLIRVLLVFCVQNLLTF